MKTGILFAAGAALLLQSGLAQAATASPVAPSISALPYQSANLPTAAQVQSFYASWQYAPIWFRSGAVNPAASDLVAVLQRSSLDGLNGGPEIASVVQAAIQRASTGDPAAVAYAEHTLSEALVLYAQTMKQPVPGMTYGYGFLMPRPAQPAEVLLGASVAPSLQAYVQQIANPNAIYTSIRDAAWRQMQASGTTVPDPRVVANLDRARGMPAKGRFVMVNAATQMLYMYQDGVPVGSMKVVVGDNGQYLKNRPDTRTPLITSMMYYVIHNPYWNSSDTLTRLNIAPRYAAEGDKYFKARGFKVMSDWSPDAKVIPTSQVDWKGVRAGKVSIRIRQDPGPDNFMGQLKFPFANPQDIYLHDTDPGDRDLFALSQRTRSNGCIRLENAPLLARWLVGHDPMQTDQPEYPEQLAQPVPIYVTYLTAQAQDGQLTFVKDVYGMDPTASTTRVASGK
jgi:murein L,D-transpeptidase YcbB/YkuD